MKQQKFKRGNVCELLYGHIMYSFSDGKNEQTDMSPEDIGKKVIIEYSYAEEFGGDNTNSYSVIFMDTGSSVAWKDENQLKFIEEGGEHLFKEAQKKRDADKKQNTDLKYILDNLESGELSSESMLYLFKMLGFRSSFLTNGEFFCLFNDWAELHPVFVCIKHAESLEDAEKLFKKGHKFNVEEVYNRFKALNIVN